MRSRGRVIITCVLAAAAASTALSTLNAYGATRTITVTPMVAAPGRDVSVLIQDHGGMFWGTDLYLILQSRYEEGSPCSEMPGAIRVSNIVWMHNGLFHDGYAKFVMPDVSDGVYALGEELPGVIPPCGPGGSITVSAGRSPDSAMNHPGMGWKTMLVMAGMMLVVASATIATRRVTARPTRIGTYR